VKTAKQAQTCKTNGQATAKLRHCSEASKCHLREVSLPKKDRKEDLQTTDTPGWETKLPSMIGRALMLIIEKFSHRVKLP
jgi:hypothetical protein